MATSPSYSRYTWTTRGGVHGGLEDVGQLHEVAPICFDGHITKIDASTQYARGSVHGALLEDA